MSSRAATAAGRRRAAQRAPRRRPAAQRATRRRPASKRAPSASVRSKPAAPSRSTRRASFGRLGAVRRWALLALVALVALGAGYFLWLRDSSLVAVTEVEVNGVSGPDGERIEGQLTRAAKRMTTLHVDTAKLEAAVASQPTVASVSAAADFPNGLVIEVRERPPTAFASTGGREVAVAADGTLLAGVPVPDGLPRIRVDELPKAGRLSAQALDQAVVVGAAPEPLRRLIDGVSYSRELGVEVTMRGRIPIRFGPSARAADKWTAAAALLADPKLEAVSYVDVRVPERPAAGGAA